MRAAGSIARALGPAQVPAGLAARARTPAHTELVAAAAAEPADLIYGGTSGGLMAAAEAAGRRGIPFALDLEDFHSEEQGDPALRWIDRANERIERDVLPRAAFLTTSSDPIAKAYVAKYGVSPVVVHNTVRLPAAAPDVRTISSGGLRLYWFSQTIGPGRGLEDVVRAAGLAGIRGELSLRGRPLEGYLETLEALRSRVAPNLRLAPLPPAHPDDMIALCGAHDIGMAAERTTPKNHDLCLTNKALTYVAAGLALVLTKTRGQARLACDLGSQAASYAPGDVDELAAALAQWAADREALAESRAASWAAATRRWHWDHEQERPALLAAVARALS
jgi:glycosyltransferase involved in cell wall biosynthesis